MKALLTLSYDGTDYCGWQRQNGQTTIQQTIEEAISKLYSQEVKILGASRTDSGVHALGQKASFSPPDARIVPHKLFLAINALLPKDIRVLYSEAVADGFHVINDVKSKEYVYRIHNSNVYNPVLYRYTYNIKEKLDITLMNEAAEFFIGEHDFSAFCAANSGAATTVRTVERLCVSEENSIISFVIRGNGFLYNMVRIIAGTLTEVGKGKIPPAEITEIIASRKRENAGITLPARGLTLLEVNY